MITIAFLLACAPDTTPHAPLPVDVDTTAPTVVADTTPLPAVPQDWSVSIEPAHPRYDSDLRCLVNGWSGDVTITWTANGVEQRGTDGTQPGDTIEHLRQAGGQRWKCVASLANGDQRSSADAVIEPPVAMVEVAPGSFDYWIWERDPNRRPTVLTRPFLIGQYETTVSEFETWSGYTPADSEGPNRPVRRLVYSDAARWLNALSAADGLTPCYVCPADATLACDRPQDPYACEGYRLPTGPEWAFAASERGRHPDPLPAGGQPVIPPETDPIEIPDDLDVTGPFAIPGTTVGSQCCYTYTCHNVAPTDVGLLLPNLLGLYDMCGNVAEMIEGNYAAIGQWTDPFEPSRSATLTLGGSYSSGGKFMKAVGSIDSERYPSATEGFRATRTNTPVLSN